MKIEICEQMVQSWLQNYKQCEIVQTNWKVSPLRLRSITDADIVELEAFMKAIGHPTEPGELGLTDKQWQEAFLMAKDIRDKYVLGRLLWDLGDESFHAV